MATRKATQRIPEGAPRSTGVGESIPHAAAFTDPGYYADELDNPRNLANCTLGGHPVPDHLLGLLAYDQTDQGVEELRAANALRTQPVTEFLRDELHQGISRHGGDLDRGMRNGNSAGVVTREAIERGFDDDEAYDERRALVLSHVPVGMRPCFLDAKRVTEGTNGGYTIARNAKGDAIMHGTSILGYMPEDRAAARQAGFERKSRDAQSEIYQNDLLQQETVMRGATPMGRFERPHPGGVDLGLQNDLGGGDELTN